MKKLLYLLLITFIGLGNTGCSDDDFEEIIIESTEFKLDAGCDWHAALEEEKVYCVNSAEELRKLVRCDKISGLDGIDFEKNTLVIVVGVEMSGVEVYNIIFTQTGSNKYVFNVIFPVSLTSVITPWEAAILVPKLNKEAKIKLIKENIIQSENSTL